MKKLEALLKTETEVNVEKEITTLIVKAGILRFAEDLELALDKNEPDQKMLQAHVRMFIDKQYK